MQWIRALNDPLRNPKLAGRWIAQLTPADPMGSQKEALELVANFPGARKEAGPNQVDALLRVDARMESVITHFTQQYCENYQKSSSVESRLWHAAFDLIKAFIAAYQNALKAGYPRAEQKRWRAILPWVVVRLAHYKGLDAKYRLFRYSHWIPAQWREYPRARRIRAHARLAARAARAGRQRLRQVERVVRAGIREDADADAASIPAISRPTRWNGCRASSRTGRRR